MKALVISTHFPKDFKKGASGTFKRLRTFLDAIKEKASIRLLFYYARELELDGSESEDASSLVRTEWELPDIEVVLCRQESDPSYGDRLWDGYLARTLSMHRQLGFVRTSGPEQVRAFEGCLDDKPDVIFAHRLNTICPLLLTRRPLPPVFMDLDDVEHKVFLRDISQPPKWFAKRLYYLQWPALLWGERRAVKLTRRTFVCSDLDAQYLVRRWGLTNVRVIPNSIRIPEPTPLPQSPVLLFLGAYGYAPNVIAAEELITRIWPLIRAGCPQAQLVIAGAGPERIPAHAQQHDGVEYTGFVDDLDALYAQARVVCCPIQSGGGTRIKVIEAAAYGKPIVSTTVGAEGLDFARDREILLRDDAQSFAEACVKLLGNDGLCRSLGEAARTKATERYDRRNVMRLIQSEIFGSID